MKEQGSYVLNSGNPAAVWTIYRWSKSPLLQESTVFLKILHLSKRAINVLLKIVTYYGDCQHTQNQNWRYRNQYENSQVLLHVNNIRQMLRSILSISRETIEWKEYERKSDLNKYRIFYQSVKCDMPGSSLQICVDSTFHYRFLVPFWPVAFTILMRFWTWIFKMERHY